MANKPFKKLRFSLSGDTYSPVDEQARQDIGDLTQLVTEHKDNLVEAINEAAQSGGGGEDNVVWATIGTTTYTQISNAINDDKLVCAKKSLASGKNRIYYCLGKPFDSNYFLFVATTPTIIYSYHVDTEDWTEQFNVDVLKLATTLPVMDGVATAGVLTKAAKADHVHPTDTSRASAADVGDLLELDTTAKNSLVDAINEALAAGSPTAQQVQDAVDAYLDAHPTETGTFTNTAKYALLALLEKVAYIVNNGQEYLDALQHALFDIAVVSITAVFTQGGNYVYDIDSLDTLKQYLVVTATYADNTTEVLPDSAYTLSGTLTEGTSVIEVAYQSVTTTFNVTVTAWDYYNYTLANGELVKVSMSTTGYTIGSEHDGSIGVNFAQTNVVRRSYPITKFGVKPMQDINDNFSDTIYFPVPIPANAVKAVVSIMPSTQYHGESFYTYDSSGYHRQADPGWKQGSFTHSFTAGQYDYMTITSKYNSAGTSYPTEPTALTVQFLTE